MQTAALVSGVNKLAMAGEQAGFSVEQMIQMLNAGVTIETLLELISWRLGQVSRTTPLAHSSNWVA